MNLRYPQIVTLLTLVALVASLMPVRRQMGMVASLNAALPPVQWLARVATPLRAGVVAERGTIGADVTSLNVVQARAESIRLAKQVESLSQRVIALEAQLDGYRQREAAAEQLGGGEGRVKAVEVIGPDAGGKGLLRLAASDVAIEPDAVVVSEAGLVGRVLGIGADRQAIVRTITDRGFTLLGEFVRVESGPDGAVTMTRLGLEPRVIEGFSAASNELRVPNLSMADANAVGLKVGDWVMLRHDRGSKPWPPEFQGQRVGTVSYVGPRVGTTGFAEVRIKPTADLLSLKQVWIGTLPDAGAR